jgi:hypothetical protein
MPLVLRVTRVIGAVTFATFTYRQFGLAVTGIIAAVLLAANLVAIRWRRGNAA